MIIQEKIKEAMNYRLGKLEPKFFRRWEELENLKIEFNYQYDVKFSKIIQSIYEVDDTKELNSNKNIFNGTNPYTSYTVDDYNYGVNGISTSNDKSNLLSNTSNSKIINQSYCNTSINISNFDVNKESNKRYIKVKQRMENILSPNIYTNANSSYHITSVINETQSKSKSRQYQRSRDSIFRLKEEEKRQILNKIAYIPIESHCLNETVSYKFKKNVKKEGNNEKNQLLPNFNTVLASDGVYKRNIIDRVYSNVKDMPMSKSLSKFYKSIGFTSNRLNSQIRIEKSENYNNLNNTLSNFSIKKNPSCSKEKDRQLTNIRTPYTTGKNCKIREDRDKLYNNFKKNHKRSSITNTKSDKILLSTKKKHKNSDISYNNNERQLKDGKNSELISRIDLKLMNNSIPIDLSIKAKEEELLKIKQRLEMEEIKRKQLEDELIKMKIIEFDDRGSFLNHEAKINENQYTIKNDNINDNIDEMTRKLRIFKEEERERNEKKRKEEELTKELERKQIEEENEKQMREEEEEKRKIEESRMKEEQEKRRREKEKAEEEERIKNDRIRLFKQKQEEMRRRQMELEEEEMEKEREEEIEKERIKEQLLKIEEDKINRYQKYEEQQLMREIKTRMITDEDENKTEKEEDEERDDTLTTEEIIDNERIIVNDNKKEDFTKIEIDGINIKVNNSKRISIINNSIQLTINNLLEKYDVYLKNEGLSIIINKQFQLTKLSTNAMQKLFTKDGEEKLKTGEQNERVLETIKLIYIIIGEEYENKYEGQDLISHLYNTILPKYNINSVSDLFLTIIIKDLDMSRDQIEKFIRIVNENNKILNPGDLSKINRPFSNICYPLKEIYEYVTKEINHNEFHIEYDSVVYFEEIRNIKRKIDILNKNIYFDS